MIEIKNKSNDVIDIPALCNDAATGVVQSLAIAQQMKQINGPDDLQKLIAAGIETAIEDLFEKMNAAVTPKIELG